MRRLAIPILVVLFMAGVPGSALAAILINEVAWMGSSDNPNAEWIELMNTGSETVNLAGYKVVSSTGSPSITISGSITSGGYYLLMRTSMNLISGVTADQAYTGALSNAGATLVLQDASGTIVDEVIGGTNWSSIGGDNTSKKTAQRSGNGWVTATPTPGTSNVVQEEDEEESGPDPVEEPEATTTQTTIGGSSATSGAGVYAFPKLYISAGPSREVVAFADTPFRAFVFDEESRPRRDARITWSFGDGSRRDGPSVRHAYQAPGEYLVVVRAAHREATAIRTLTVTVAPADVAVTDLSDAGIMLTNHGDDVLDLSYWKFEALGKRFTIPEDTALLPGHEVLFPASVTRLATSTKEVSLTYPSGRVAASYAPIPPSVPYSGKQLRSVTPIAVPPPSEPVEAPEAAPRPEPLSALLWGFAKTAVTSLF